MAGGRQYFTGQDGDPAPLVARASRRVRFEEVDLLGMLWHGRYAGYFEDGRMAFGRRYGLSYQAFREHGTVAPVVRFHVDYQHPLRFDEECTILCSLHWCDAARLNFSYHLENQAGRPVAGGYTVQLFTDVEGTVLLLPPEWLGTFRQQWRQGLL